MPLKYQQQFKILYTTKSGCLPSCHRRLLKVINFHAFVYVNSLPPNPIFGAAYRLMSESKQHMTNIDQTVF